MATLPTGTIYAVATVFAAPRTITAITNAVEGVVTSAAHGYTDGTILQITSGWGRLNRRVMRVKGSTVNTFVMEAIDTTNLAFYPAGSGLGTARSITTFQQINSILNPSASGGEPKTVTVKFLASDVETKLNDGFAAISESFDIDADEFGGAAYTALVTLSEVQTDTVIRKTLRTGSTIFTPCRVSLNQNPKLTEGQIITNAASIDGNGLVTRY